MPRSVALAAGIVFVVILSNVAVQYPLNDWVTLGAFTYPLTFLIIDLTNFSYGPRRAYQLVFLGFFVGCALSAYLATPRIAVASATAFLMAQCIDVWVFHRLRRRRWWIPPLLSSSAGSTIDTIFFFSLAFYGTGLPWVTWAIGDLGAKAVTVSMSTIIFRQLRARFPTWQQQSAS